MLVEGAGYTYNMDEKPFVEYFNRCYDIKMSKGEIKNNLGILQKYYDDMVVPNFDSTDIWRGKSLENLFNDWSYCQYYFDFS